MKINYALSGLGGIAKTHLMGLKNLALLELPVDFKIDFKTLVSTHPEEKKELAKEIGFDEIISDFDKALKKDIDLVDLCTPNFLHAEEILKAISAQKHIYCEKPLTLNLKVAEEIVSKIDQTKLKNQLGFVFRFSPAAAYAHALLKNNVIGKPQFVKIEYYHSRYLNPEVPISWRLKKSSSGGGALVDLGSHMIDLSRFLLGEFKVSNAWTKTFIEKRKDQRGNLKKVDVDDWALLMLNFNSEAQGTLETSRVSPGNEGFRFKIFADQGAIHFNSDNIKKVKLFNQSSEEIAITETMTAGDMFLKKILQLYPSSKLSQGMMVDLHLISLVFFIESIVTNKIYESIPDFQDGYEVQKIIDAAYKAAAQNN